MLQEKEIESGDIGGAARKSGLAEDVGIQVSAVIRRAIGSAIALASVQSFIEPDAPAPPTRI
ncbi:hypothetical protein PSCICF_23610 [Pseudomonas cichorii]|nr:hypothetical protein PSCICF_23610 [Pseudomonas cichorii]